MNRILYAGAAAAADRAAMDLGIPSLVLMERAALSVVHFLDHHREQYDVTRVVAVCGPGNNGGTGLRLCAFSVSAVSTPASCSWAAVQNAVNRWRSSWRSFHV